MLAEKILREELQALPRLSRAQLAKELIASLDEPEPVNVLDLLWGEEAEQRLKDLKAGSTRPLPGKEVLTEARKLVNL